MKSNKYSLGSKNKKNSKNSAEKPKAIKIRTKKLANTTAESVSNTTTVAPSTSGYSLRNRINRSSRQSESNEVDAVQNTDNNNNLVDSLNNSNNNSLIIRNISVHHSTLIDEDQNDTFNPPAIEIEENKLASIDSCYLFENQKSKTLLQV